MNHPVELFLTARVRHEDEGWQPQVFVDIFLGREKVFAFPVSPERAASLPEKKLCEETLAMWLRRLHERTP